MFEVYNKANQLVFTADDGKDLYVQSFTYFLTNKITTEMVQKDNPLTVYEVDGEGNKVLVEDLWLE